MSRLKILLTGAIFVHIAAFLLMIFRVEPFYTFFYLFAWWSFILAVASHNQLTKGNSMVLGRGSEFAWLAFFSLCFWLFFEAYNFRLDNWHYLAVPYEPYLRWPGFILAFATVCPGLLETETLLRNHGVAHWPAMRSVVVTRGVLIRSLAIGLLMMAAPLVSPHLFFPFLWVGLIFLIDPLVFWSERHSRSLFAHVQRGEYGKVVRLFLAGLLCGFLWEFWNFWAGSKWYYTIPYFNFLKVFEMPVLGYLGFGFFALEAYLAYECFLSIRIYLQRRSTFRLAVLCILAVCFVVATLYGINAMTVVSYKLLLG